MRYLAFSVLVILAIGLFAVPGVFADHDSDEHWGTAHVEKSVLELPYSAWDNSEYEKIQIFSSTKFFKLPRKLPQVETSWLAFPLTISSDAPFTRLEIVKYLESNGIQTRPIFTGNVLRQPAFKKINYKKLTNDFHVANNIMKNSFLIGCNHGLNDHHINKIQQTFLSFLQKI